MICISVAPSSRRLAAADLFNASKQCDLIELCLDQFERKPDVGALLDIVDKPILVSCRQPRDGGHWVGPEEDRISLIRNAIAAGPEYVEMNVELAEQIPRFGTTKRVINYTNLHGPLNRTSVNSVIQRCLKANADVVKFTWLTETLDDMWPLLSVATQNRDVPVVGKGIGPGGLAFSLLARRYGSPWIYAALEQGMATSDGEATVAQLNEEYCCSDVTRQTRFVGIVGRGIVENTTSRILNAAFKEFQVPIRCLPVIPGRPDRLRKMLEILKIHALIIHSEFAEQMHQLVDEQHRTVGEDGYMDIMSEKQGRWKARATLFDSIETATSGIRNSKNWAQGRVILIIGADALSMSMASRFQEMNSAVSLASPSDNSAARAAKQAGVRHVPWNAIHSLMVEGVILTDASIKCGTGRGELNPSLLRERLTVVDLLSYPAESAIAQEAQERGCHYVNPAMIFACQMQKQFRYLTGKSLPLEAFRKGLGG
ncbi:MAG: type I 3-dehydroquinate dehydratase [Fuerstiella sp.]|nr:type I 3-dehydroquinate dehydratase [Fuerstiella sp.]